ncbi:MAG: NADH-quinone oxidoreductase subunit L [Bacillota bacterium]|jgi:NADH-quinone oxidoreductase subunit L|nr:NADH-quinone oxidoreductase subunit L [Candidatus Fermentithermobacillaceae bacterium]
MSDLPFVLVVVLPFLGALLVWVSRVLGGGKAAPYVALGTGGVTAAVAVSAVPWVHGGQAAFGLAVDGLGFFVALASSLLGALVLLYSLGYMAHERDASRYYSLVLLTIGSVNGLTLSGNALIMAAFWMACSTLTCQLVGFNRENPDAPACAKKALVFGRASDLLLLLGIGLLYYGSEAGGFGLAEIAGALPGATSALIAPGAYAIMLAAMVRSAQIPLHVWLPGAMEAPSSASALLDAATVMNAGVYLVMRFYPVLRSIPGWASTVMWTGGLTILASALMALYANDIKKMLAFSTMSQLGYMFFAVGTGAILGAQFHLMSHAIFKTLLFLAAGSVVHSTGTRDMNLLSGAASRMPVTGAAFLVGVMGLSGVPFMSGFFSKDMVLAGALAGHQYGALALAGFGAVLTVVYSWSSYIRVFRGNPSRVVRGAAEAPLSMEIPMVILAILTAFSWMSIGIGSGELQRTVPGLGIHTISPLYLVEETFGSAAFFISLIALALGFLIVRKRREVFGWLEAHATGLVSACKEGFYLDRLFVLPEGGPRQSRRSARRR